MRHWTQFYFVAPLQHTHCPTPQSSIKKYNILEFFGGWVLGFYTQRLPAIYRQKRNLFAHLLFILGRFEKYIRVGEYRAHSFFVLNLKSS